MTTQAGFVLKVLVLSAVLSILIKYAGPYIPIPATGAMFLGNDPLQAIALILVFLPTLFMAFALWRRAYLYKGTRD